jgi:nicotinamide-nucleotide amidase
MKAAVLAVGSEMLGTSRLDTNSLRLARTLEKYGLGFARKSVVEDVQQSIVDELRHLAARFDLIIVTGGLGPTEDDLTKEAVAEAFHLKLEEDAGILQRMEERFAARGFKMAETNRKQALVFVGQKTLVNERGTAPGFHLVVDFESAQRHIWIFPGVPTELEAMVDRDLEGWLQKTRNLARHRRVIKITGLPESEIDQRLKPFYRKHSDLPVTILASHGEIQIHLQVDGGADDAYARLNEMEQELRTEFGERIFGLDDDEMESVVGRLLAQRGETIATAESCTGGLLASRLTDVSGSSRYFMGGVIAYSREAKLSLLGVDPAAIDSDGEVSEEVAKQLAVGARRRFGTTYGIGITGIAGPTGGTEKKPVGTVHIAVAGPTQTVHRHAQLMFTRELVKHFSTQIAMDMLRLMIVRG